MPRGGARPGAGRPRKPRDSGKAPAKGKKNLPDTDADGFKPPDAGQTPFGKERPQDPPDAPPLDPPPEELADMSPLDYMLFVMRNPVVPLDMRMRAAQNALPFCHAKKGEASSKKEEEAARKKSAQSGRFGRRQPPSLTAVQGGKS